MNVIARLTPRRPQRALGLAGLAATLLLAACAESAPFNFYTLVGPASTPPATRTAARAPLLIEVMPTTVPQQVQRPQLVLTTGAGQVRIVEQQRWSQPVADEISQALSQDLTRGLPAIDVYRSAHPETQPVYRVALNVQRFESVPGSHATLDAVWSVTLNPRGLTMTCRAAVTEPVLAPGMATTGTGMEAGTESDYAALVAAHRRAIQQLSDEIASAIGKLETLPAGDKPAAPAAGTTGAPAFAPNIACPAAP